MPLYEDLARRVLEAQERAALLGLSAARTRELASLLRRAHKGEIVLRRCAWCSRLALADERLHLEAIGDGQQRIASSLLERATNGICPECFEQVADDAEAHRLRPRGGNSDEWNTPSRARNGSSKLARLGLDAQKIGCSESSC